MNVRTAIAVFGLALALLAPATALSQSRGSDQPDTPHASPSATPSDPLDPEALPEEQSTEDERESSQTAYADSSDAEALALFEQQFGAILAARLIPELDLFGGQEVESYLGRYTARIDVPGQSADLLAESTMPLRAPEGGEKRPLEDALIREGDHFEAENPLSETEIAAEPRDGILLEEAGITASPAAVPAPTPSRSRTSSSTPTHRPIPTRSSPQPRPAPS